MIVETETARLILRRYAMSDIDAYRTLRASPEVWRFSTLLPDVDAELTYSELARVVHGYEHSRCGFCALYLKSSGDYIGEAGFIGHATDAHRAVLGYNLLPQFWGHGYATEVVAAAIQAFSASPELIRLEATVVAENTKSRGVLERTGFSLDGTMRKYVRLGDAFTDVCIYSIVK